MNIFLSYGHDDNQWIVEQIKMDLEKPEYGGHNVWIDTSEIKFTDDWRRKITDGIQDSQMVFSFLSKHSIRDPGVCLDELAIAVGVKGGNVHSILIEKPDEVKPPVSISHLQYLDMHEWRTKKNMGSKAFNLWYQEKLEKIVKVLADPINQRFAGEIRELEKILVPISTSGEISRLLKNGFVGREWLFKKIDQWRLATNNQQVFCITGKPGIGKSAIAASLAHHAKSHVIGINFCRHDQPDSGDVSRIIRTLAFQIATRIPDYRKFLLDKLNILIQEKSLPEYNAAELFRELIAASSYFCIDGNRERYLVVIDGLDEAPRKSGEELVRLIAQQKDVLPIWLKFIVTSRPGEAQIVSHLTTLSPQFIDADEPNNNDDIRNYIKKWFECIKLAPDEQNRLIEPLVAASEGNFLYLKAFRDMVEQSDDGKDILNDITAYPKGLSSFYVTWLQRKYSDGKQFKEEARPLLELIIASPEPLPVDVAISTLSVDNYYIKDFAAAMGALIDSDMLERERRLSLFHRSFAEWFGQAAAPYSVDATAGKLRLAKILWDEFVTGGIDGFDGFVANTMPQLLLEISEKQRRQILGDANRITSEQLLFAADALRDNYKLKQSIDIRIILLHELSILKGVGTETIECLLELCNILSLQGDYDKAEQYYNHAIDICNKYPDLSKPYNNILFNNIALLYRNKGMLRESNDIYNKIIEEDDFDNEDIKAVTMSNYSQLLMQVANYKKALDYSKVALSILIKKGLERKDTIIAMNNYSLCLLEMGEYSQALHGFEQIIQLLNTVGDFDTHFKAIAIHNFALCLSKLELNEDAIRQYELAHKMFEATLGRMNPLAINCLKEKATLLWKTDHNKALAIFEELDDIYKNNPQLKDPNIDILNKEQLKDIIDDNFGEKDILSCFSKFDSWIIDNNKLDKTSPEVSIKNTISCLMASKYHDDGDYDSAMRLYEDSLAHNIQNLGDKNIFTAVDYNNLGSLHHDKSDLNLAKSCYQQALSIFENEKENRSIEYICCLNNLSSLLIDLEDYDEALVVCERSLNECRHFLVKNSLDTACSLNNFATVLLAKGNNKKALQLYKEAFEIYKNSSNNDHPNYVYILSTIASLLVDDEKHTEAIPFYQEALIIFENLNGDINDNTIEILVNLATIYHTLGNYKSALNLYERGLIAHKKLYGPNDPLLHKINNCISICKNNLNEKTKQPPAKSIKISRNDLCPCGSNKKYKKCCGA